MHAKVLRITRIEFSFECDRFIIHSQQFTVLLMVLIYDLIRPNIGVLSFKFRLGNTHYTLALRQEDITSDALLTIAD